MNDLKTKRGVKVPKTKRYKRLRTVALFNIVLLLLNIFSFFWISDLTVLQTKAATATSGLCLTICMVAGCEVTDCEDLVNPPTPGCTDDTASNYNPNATEDDGSCDYGTGDVEPEDTTVVPGAGPIINPLVTPEGLLTEEEIDKQLVVGESLPFYNNVEAVDSSRIERILLFPGIKTMIPSEAISSYLTFYGKTNIADAIIIISLTSSQTYYGTIKADSDGYWQWTTQQFLLIGDHYVTALAMSPTNTQVKEVAEARFYLEEPVGLPPVIPGEVTPLEIPEIFPPIELPPIEITEDIYILDLDVISDKEPINPGDDISLVTDIISFAPGRAEEVILNFVIKDSTGQIIFEDDDILTVKDSASVIKRLRLKKSIEPGNYVATVQLTKEDVTYLTSVGFRVEEVEEEPLFILPGRIAVSRGEVQRGLFTSFVFLSFLMILFIILLWREYQRAKHEVQISGRDLWQDGQIV